MSLTPPEPRAASPANMADRRAALSPAGRQRFGEWLANRLTIAAGGLGGLVLVPSLLKPDVLDPPLQLATGALVIVLAAAGVAVHYLTAEREGDPPRRQPGDQ